MCAQSAISGAENFSIVEKIGIIYVPETTCRKPIKNDHNKHYKFGQINRRQFSRFMCIQIADYVSENRAYSDFNGNLILTGAFNYTQNQLKAAKNYFLH